MYPKKLLCVLLLLVSSKLFAQHFGNTSSTWHTIFIDEDGKAYGWGYNDLYALGIGEYQLARTPTEVISTLPWVFAASGGFTGIYIGIDSNLYFTGQGRLPSYYGNDVLTAPSLYPRLPGVNGWQSASLYRDKTHIALTSDGVAYYWDGQKVKDPTIVEFPSGVTKWIKVVAGDGYYLLLSSDSSLYGFGANNYGQLGNQNGLNTTALTRVFNPIGVYKWKTMSAGGSLGYSVGISDDGRLFRWGILYHNTPTISDSAKYQPTLFASAEQWKDVQISELGTVVALTTTGRIYVWGGRDSILLGLGDGSMYLKEPAPMPFPEGVTEWKDISVKADAAFALDQDCRVWGWGYNSDGNSIGLPQDSGYIFPTPRIIKQFCGQGSVGERKDQAAFEVQAYPNPAADEIKLSLQASNLLILTCDVLDVLGRSVMPSRALDCIEGSNNFLLDLSDVQPGNYFLRLSSSHGNVRTIRITKNDSK